MTSEILVRRYDKLSVSTTATGTATSKRPTSRGCKASFPRCSGSRQRRSADVAKLWDGYWQALLATMDHVVDGRISRHEWQEGHARLAGDEASYNRVITPLMTALFRLADTDGDGKMSPAEWRSFQESIGNGDAAESSFQHMDTNHNEYLTVEELLDAAHEYLTSPDPDARGGWFFGDV